MRLLANELISFHCKLLENNSPSGYYLDSTLHILTPTKIYYIAVSITFELITLLYSNMSSSIDAMSGDI